MSSNQKKKQLKKKTEAEISFGNYIWYSRQYLTKQNKTKTSLMLKLKFSKKVKQTIGLTPGMKQ